MPAKEPNYGNRPIEDEGLFCLYGRAWAALKARFGRNKDPISRTHAGEVAFARRFSTLRFCCAVGGIAGLQLSIPAHPAAAFLSTALLTVPLSLLLFILSRKAAQRSIKTLPKTRIQKGTSLCYWAISLLLATTGAYWAANIALDRAPAVRTPFAVIAKHETQGRNGPQDYLTVNMQSYKVFGLDLGTPENVRVTPLEYEAASADSMQLELTLHPGFLGLPWYERKHALTKGRTDWGHPHSEKTQHHDNAKVFTHTPSPLVRTAHPPALLAPALP